MIRQVDLNKLRPARGKLLGEVLEDSKSTGGIVIVSIKKKKPRKVRVISIGASVFEHQSSFLNTKGEFEDYRAKPGDVAYFKLAEGQKLTLNRKEYLVLENKDIVAVEA